jgi:hypothetical protein
MERPGPGPHLQTVMPGEKREIPLKFSVSYPAEMQVTGLE